RRRAARSVAPVALFLPWVTAVVIAERLPEAWLVVFDDAQPSNPLGALPEIQVGDEQARRAAVLRVERLPLIGVHDPGLAPRDVAKRQMRRIAAITERNHVTTANADTCEQGIQRDALPVGIQLRPLCYAVDVLRHRLARQGAELAPGPPSRRIDAPLDGE